MPLTALIVDDEPLAREGLRDLLSRDPEIAAIREARDGREAVVSIREGNPDIVFLDVQMPEMDGFAVVRTVGAENMPAVVFVTAHDWPPRCGHRPRTASVLKTHGWNQILIPKDPGLRKVFPNLALPMRRLGLGQTEILDEVPAHLAHNLIGPFRQIQPRSRGQSQEGICQRHWNENARIQNRRKISSHSSSPPSGRTLRS
jgi:chemotaxis response regulator CheB